MIPNIFHFVHLSIGDTPRLFSLHHYLCIKSCHDVNSPDHIYLYCNVEPSGTWWDKAKQYVEVVIVEPPTEIFGIPITHPAHMSDVIRLQALIETGGFYADTDTLFVKSFKPLLKQTCVLGMQGREGICPAIIGSVKDGQFVSVWLQQFQSHFKGGPPGSDGWCVHSVYLPFQMALQVIQEAIRYAIKIPLVTLMPEDAFFYPLYHKEDLQLLFEENHSFDSAYSFHLWETQSKEYLDKLSVEYINTVDTTYNVYARRFL